MGLKPIICPKCRTEYRASDGGFNCGSCRTYIPSTKKAYPTGKELDELLKTIHGAVKQ